MKKHGIKEDRSCERQLAQARTGGFVLLMGSFLLMIQCRNENFSLNGRDGFSSTEQFPSHSGIRDEAAARCEDSNDSKNPACVFNFRSRKCTNTIRFQQALNEKSPLGDDACKDICVKKLYSPEDAERCAVCAERVDRETRFLNETFGRARDCSETR